MVRTAYPTVLLSNADPTLTLDKESEILGLPGFLPEAAAAFSERLRLFSEDTETLWDELIDFCEREYQKQYITDIDTPTADRIVEALARRGAPVAAKVLSMLNEDLDTSIYTPREFMQGFILQLAGEMQLTETIPLFIKTLKKDDADDWHNGICQRALVKIGGEEVFEAITQELPTDDWHFRLFGYSVLEEAHAGKNVEKYIELFNAEKDEDLKIILGRAALLHFSSTAIEPVRQFLLHRKEDPNPEITELCEYLVSVSTLLEIDFPEREKWKKENDKARMECDQKIAELERVFFKETIEEGGNVNDFIDKILQEAGGIVGAVDDDTLFDDNVFDDDGTFDEINNEYLESMSSESTILRSDIKIGRNDPCPCNSGKKYKKCCIKKNNEASLFN